MDDLQISDLAHKTAQELYDNGLDNEYIHIYIYCIEKIKALHDAGIVHADVKPDMFMNNASVICDFSLWDRDNYEP